MSEPNKIIKISKEESDLLGKNIQRLLKERYLSDNDLASSLRLPVMTIRRIISGETSDPRISTLKLIAGYFEVSIDELLSNQDEIIRAHHMEKNLPQFIPILDWPTAAKISTINDLNLAQWKRWHPITFSDEYKVSKDTFILESTPSLYPVYPHGTLFVVDPEASVLDGDIILIKSKKNGDISLRELIIDLPERKLLPIIPNSPSILFSERDHTIVGVIILTLSYKNKRGSIEI